VVRLVPIVPMAVTPATAIRLAIKAYSIAVTPLSFFIKRKTNRPSETLFEARLNKDERYCIVISEKTFQSADIR
jgi:hypothetical protein